MAHNKRACPHTHTHTQAQSENLSDQFSSKSEGQTALIGEANQTPAAAAAVCGDTHPLSKLSLTTTNTDTRMHQRHNRISYNKPKTGALRQDANYTKHRGTAFF